MRTLQKFARDLLVTNIIGQVLVAAIGFVTALMGVPNLGIEPVFLVKAATVLSATLAVYRLARQYFGPFVGLTPPQS